MKKTAKIATKAAVEGVRGRYEVPMVVRALQVIELVADAGGRVSLNDVVARTRITRSSAYRILRTLESRRYVTRDATSGDVTLGPRLDELQRLTQARDRLEVRAEPFMQQLRSQFDETVNLGVLRGNQIVYARVFESQRRFRIRADEGASAPFHASALGKAVLAFLPKTQMESLIEKHTFEVFTAKTIKTRARLLEHLLQVRSTGLGRDDEEIELGASCVAVPVLDASGYAVGAISVSGPTARMAAIRTQLEAALRQAGKTLSKDML